MHQHGPDKLIGPMRGTRVWWQELETLSKSPDPAADPSQGHEEGPPKNKKNRKIHEDPFVRKDLVARVRQEIADGTYDTQEKWEAALDRLLDHLAGG